MGFLDPKTRILDTLITEEGRFQLSQGRLRVSRVAFSDSSTFYEYDIASGSSDVTSRVYFEACSLPQDQITFQADDSGRLQPFTNPTGINVIHGKLVSGSAIVPEDGTQFASLADSLLESSERNFSHLAIIGSIDPIFEDHEFELSVDEVTFTITNDRPLPSSVVGIRHISTVPSFFQDPRLSHLPNFKFMPPVVKTGDGQTVRELAKVADIGSAFKSDNDFRSALSDRMKTLELEGGCKTVTMDPTSRENNIFMQMFEVSSDGTMVKLDVVKFANASDHERPVYFVGKIVRDGDEFKFFNIFTLTLE